MELALLLAPLACAQFTWTVEADESGLIIHVRPPAPNVLGMHALAAFSGDLVAERVHTLTDGSHIREPETAQHVLADGQGRARVETTLFSNGATWNPSVITISDPHAGFMYIFFEGEKTAHRLKRLPDRAALKGARSRPVPEEPSVTHLTSTKGVAVTREILEPRSMEGVQAQGVRTTSVYPVDSRGNDRPITVVEEHWTTPEFGLMLAMISDPIAGDKVTRLQNVRLAAPDPSVFAPPPEYAIEDVAAPFTVRLKRQ